MAPPPDDAAAAEPSSPSPPPPMPPPPPPPAAAVQYVRASLFLFVFTVLFVVPVLVGVYTMAVVVAVELSACLNVVHAFSRALFRYVAANAVHAVTSAALGLSAAVALLCAVGFGFGLGDDGGDGADSDGAGGDDRADSDDE